ncbi:hypothetical protein KP509_07G101100 [Ceratopteris richardii]|uniref:CDK5RAP3-like protein n=1 Tax=Ceratopteris richardii TaxID=49495 RepID=A0A8T2UHY6_CERRI|nr:hypothetical protein KP509_07G101100 [Ceratopteris richardii]
MEEQELPIDISFSKLSDWLADRKRIPVDWRKRLLAIRSKIQAALPRLPKDLHPSFAGFSAEDIGYLEAKHILGVLTTTQPETRTLFGRLSGIAGDWDSIVRAYEKDNVFLGASAQVMTQIVTYEIPYFKKQITKFQQQLADIERKESEYKRSASAAALKYQQSCQELGINGINIKAELIATTSNLPHIFTEVEEVLCDDLMHQTVKCYEAFVSYAWKESGKHDAVVQTLQRLQTEHLKYEIIDVETDSNGTDQWTVDANTNASQYAVPRNVGNTDVHWDTGMVLDPEEVSQGTSFEAKEKVDQSFGTSAHSCDFGKNDVSSGILQESIDWDTGDVPDSTVNMASDIQWDLSNIEQFETGPGEIQWDISIEDTDFENISQPIESGDHVHEADHRLPNISSKFMDAEFRNNLLNDLLELKAFLFLRSEESKREETSSLQNQVQAIAPQDLQQYGIDSFKQMSAAVLKAIGLLTNKRTRDMIMIVTSQRFLKRLEETLLQKKQQESKLLENLKDLQQKQVELRNMLAATWPKQVKRQKFLYRGRIKFMHES